MSPIDQINRFSIETEDFSLAREDELKLTRGLEQLTEKTPANSITYLKIKNQGHRFRVALRIKALKKSFSVVGQGPDLYTVYKQLESDVEAQLLEWKKQRFQIPNIVAPSTSQTNSTLLNQFENPVQNKRSFV